VASSAAPGPDDAPDRPAPLRTRRFGLAGRLAVVALVLVVGGVGVWFLNRATTPKATLNTADIPALQVTPAAVAPGSAIPVDLTAAEPVDGAPTSLTDWAGRVATATGIPEPAVWAYGNAELGLRTSAPSCHLSWATIAGIGRVESDHGQFGGAHLLANGVESKPIIGVPLDGSTGVRAVADTDHGRLDGDPVHDRAVGPLQFLPSTWASYGVDAADQGPPNPENINDAAMAAGRYLCADGRDLSTADDWWSAVLSYNNSVDYAQKVFGLADNYARQAQTALSGDAH
jgi:hypothetical protein